MKYFWDLFRWRFVALFWIGVWWLRGAPMEDLPPIGRWKTTVWAWRIWRDVFMFKHEKKKSINIETLIAHYKSQGRM